MEVELHSAKISERMFSKFNFHPKSLAVPLSGDDPFIDYGSGQDYKEKHKLDSKQISNSPC